MELNDHKMKRSALRRASSSRRTTRSAAVRIELRASPITRSLLFSAATNKNRMEGAAGGSEI
ncbi:hypothetical protein WUBG_00524 [Wuchereria bancrofti]|uniref:Uncharacterized protein n=1 Tax=Wuchereria bancrofti TaxID=6293 RepID=J9FMI5_WUCBA|nr:hypothetical protein WUBG_00524 [Wuchereria bancrofti]